MNNTGVEDVVTFLQARFALIESFHLCLEQDCSWRRLNNLNLQSQEQVVPQFAHLIAKRSLKLGDEDDDDEAAAEVEIWDVFLVRVEPANATTTAKSVTAADVMRTAASSTCRCFAGSKRLLVFEDGGGFSLREVKRVFAD